MDEPTRQLMERIENGVREVLRAGVLVIEARRFVLDRLADGELHRSRDLVTGFQPDPSGGTMSNPPGSVPDVSELVRDLARRASAIEALGLLVSDGVVVEVSPYDSGGMSGGVGGGFDSLSAQFQVEWMSGGSGSRGGGGVHLPLAASPARVRLARPSLGIGRALDPILFRDDLDRLSLDERTLRALDEAFRAFRFGLYLSTAVLSGTVIEGGVRTLAQRLRSLTTPTGERDLGSTQLRTVTKRLFEIIRAVSTKELPARADQLASHVHRFVDLRNYGAHSGETDHHLEHWFVDDFQGAVLLADVRHTLLALADAIEDRLAAEE